MRAILTDTAADIPTAPTTDYRIIFINWPVDDNSITSCDLFNVTHFAECKIAFFDPLEFAVSRGLWSSGNDLSRAEYIPYSENDFLRYLAAIKSATHAIRDFLQGGGTLVIRSNIPPSYIKVCKKSASGASTYTDSVVSSFFWLEDFLGKTSFENCAGRVLKFLIPERPIAQVFDGTPVDCVQTQNSIGKGQVTVIAACGPSLKQPAISQVSLKPDPGQIYLVPRFLVGREHQLLIKALTQEIQNLESGKIKPRWADYYETELNRISRLEPEIQRIELEIKALKKQKRVVRKKQQKIIKLAGLLYHREADLTSAVRTALEILGLGCPERLGAGEAATFFALDPDKIVGSIIVSVADSQDGPLSEEDVRRLVTVLESRRSKAKIKGILVGNVSPMLPPAQRDIWFDPDSVSLARRNDICLLPTFELYLAVHHVLSRSDSPSAEAIKSALRRSLIECDECYVLDGIRFRR